MTLSCHEGNSACASSNIKKFAILGQYGHDSTKQNTIGIHLHGAALIHHFELLETEYTHLQPTLKLLILCTLRFIASYLGSTRKTASC
jgi:hypothetical protein